MKACVIQELSGPSGMSHVDMPDGAAGAGGMRANRAFGTPVRDP